MAAQLVETSGSALPALTPEGERFALRQRQAKMFAASPLVPEHLRKGSPEQALANCYIALTLAEAMGEVPLIVMQNIHVVNGKAGFASQYMIARANSSGIFKGRIDWRIDKADANNLSVTAYAYLRETGQEVSVTCDMKMAKAEGWTKNPKYGTMPEVMLRYRSAAFLVRFYAPDVMLGYQSAEEVEDVVHAALPSPPALSAKMLRDQSQPEAIDSTATATDDSHETPHDEETGEVFDDDDQGTPEPFLDERDREFSAEVNDTDHLPAARAKADEIIAAINAPECNAVMDVATVLNRYQLDLAALPEALAKEVNDAADARRAEIRAAQAKATEPAE